MTIGPFLVGTVIALVMWFVVLPLVPRIEAALGVLAAALWAVLVIGFRVMREVVAGFLRVMSVASAARRQRAADAAIKDTPELGGGTTPRRLPWYLVDLDTDWVDMLRCVHVEYVAGDLGPDAMEDDIGRYMAYALAAREKRIAEKRIERERRARCLAGATGVAGWTREVAPPPEGSRPNGPPPARGTLPTNIRAPEGVGGLPPLVRDAMRDPRVTVERVGGEVTAMVPCTYCGGDGEATSYRDGGPCGVCQGSGMVKVGTRDPDGTVAGWESCLRGCARPCERGATCPHATPFRHPGQNDNPVEVEVVLFGFHDHYDYDGNSWRIEGEPCPRPESCRIAHGCRVCGADVGTPCDRGLHTA